MKTLEKGRQQKDWARELVCKGASAASGCGAKLLVEESDLYAHRYEDSSTTNFICPECGQENTVPATVNAPWALPDLPTWKKRQADALSVLPADAPKDGKIGFFVHEVISGSPEAIESDKQLFKPEVMEGTDEADRYRGGAAYASPKGRVWTSVPVLQGLWGKPWNNMALNYLDMLRPSSVQVIGYRGSSHADMATWRVTVHLAEDGRTIREIHQEVEGGARGIRHGADLSAYLEGRPFLPMGGPGAIFNPRGLKKLAVERVINDAEANARELVDHAVKLLNTQGRPSQPVIRQENRSGQAQLLFVYATYNTETDEDDPFVLGIKFCSDGTFMLDVCTEAGGKRTFRTHEPIALLSDRARLAEQIRLAVNTVLLHAESRSV